MSGKANRHLVNFRGTKDFALVANRTGGKGDGGNGKTTGAGGVVWTSCQFALGKNETGGKNGGSKGTFGIKKPNGVQYSYNPIGHMTAWKFGVWSATLLQRIMAHYPATSGTINFVYELNRNFAPKGITWVKISRPCNMPGTGEGVTPIQPKSKEYVSKQVPSLEELIGGMASPDELRDYSGRNVDPFLENYNEFWHQIWNQIYQIYRKK